MEKSRRLWPPNLVGSLTIIFLTSAVLCAFIFYLSAIKSDTFSSQEEIMSKNSVSSSSNQRMSSDVEETSTITVLSPVEASVTQVPQRQINKDDEEVNKADKGTVGQAREKTQVRATPSPSSGSDVTATRLVPSFITVEGWTDVNPRLSTGPGFPEDSEYFSIFEESTVVGFYGAYDICQMGILGCLPLEELSEVLDGYLLQYDELNGPDKSVVGAFHYIADIAQSDPGVSGDYIRHVELENVTQYANFCEKEDLLLFIDLQVGWGDVSVHIDRFLPLLKMPHVHLALDPEWATKYSDVPPGGDYIGRLTAAEIDTAQRILSDLVIKYDLPRKALVVHQFLSIMLPDETFADVPEVDLIIDADGWGTPAAKLADFSQFSLGPSSEWPAIKLFFDWDNPILRPIELMQLSFPPAYVIYQ